MINWGLLREASSLNHVRLFHSVYIGPRNVEFSIAALYPK